jgi:hypothetical protein
VSIERGVRAFGVVVGEVEPDRKVTLLLGVEVQRV